LSRGFGGAGCGCPYLFGMYDIVNVDFQ